MISPLAETTAVLLTLELGPAAHPGEKAWLGTHRNAYGRRLAADWPRRRRIMEADVLARSARLGHGGWVAALDGCGRGSAGWARAGRSVLYSRTSPGVTLVSAPLLSANGLSHRRC